MLKLHCSDAKQMVSSLISKNILSQSPDGNKVKFTEYGVESYLSMKNAQKEWENQPIIRTATIDQKQIIINADEKYKADRILRDIVQEARTELCIIDAYLGCNIFDLIVDLTPCIKARLISSNKTSKTVFTTYKAIREKNPGIELRITDEGKIHDRYILLDGNKAYHFGHSFKDLGSKDTQINSVNDIILQYDNFEKRWAKSTKVE
ncbi:MAG: hypothetical protein P9M03_01050 [Candidatus Theseobacter exili]|nr:hypothetical protein [Candidatus Theseobacter exili]